MHKAKHQGRKGVDRMDPNSFYIEQRGVLRSLSPSLGWETINTRRLNDIHSLLLLCYTRSLVKSIRHSSYCYVLVAPERACVRARKLLFSATSVTRQSLSLSFLWERSYLGSSSDLTSSITISSSLSHPHSQEVWNRGTRTIHFAFMAPSHFIEWLISTWLAVLPPRPEEESLSHSTVFVQHHPAKKWLFRDEFPHPFIPIFMIRFESPISAIG